MNLNKRPSNGRPNFTWIPALHFDSDFKDLVAVANNILFKLYVCVALVLYCVSSKDFSFRITTGCSRLIQGSDRTDRAKLALPSFPRTPQYYYRAAQFRDRCSISNPRSVIFRCFRLKRKAG